MSQLPGFVNLLPAIPALLAHLAGVVAAVVLLVRQERRSVPAILALVGFGLLLLLDVANLARGPLINLITDRTAGGIRLAVVSVGCCCSVFDMIASVCLIVAIWQALTSAAGEGVS